MSKEDYKSDFKVVGNRIDTKDIPIDNNSDSKYEEEIFYSDSKQSINYPKFDLLELIINPSESVEVTSPLDLFLRFQLDRDVVGGKFIIKFLVDACHHRIIKILKETQIEDYIEGENELDVSIPYIDISGIEPSTLTNAGLLMAVFIVNDVEVASVNMVRINIIILLYFYKFFIILISNFNIDC